MNEQINAILKDYYEHYITLLPIYIVRSGLFEDDSLFTSGELRKTFYDVIDQMA